MFLVFGKTGWIGRMLGDILQKVGEPFVYAESRLEDRGGVEKELDHVRPSYVLNAAGVTGRPNVDWCETHQTDTVRANLLGCVTLADVCMQRGIHMTYYGTGCIFHYDEKHPAGDASKGFTENDRPNFTSSFYSYTKAITEDLLRLYPNVLTLRIRMPIDGDLSNPRNFITKITRYAKVVNVPNSMTVLPELLPLSLDMTKRGIKGVVNLTNPGSISHNEILELYREHIDPNFTWTNFSLEEQQKVIVAPRSNNTLETARIQEECPGVLAIRDSLLKYVFMT